MTVTYHFTDGDVTVPIAEYHRFVALYGEPKVRYTINEQKRCGVVV